MILTVLAVLVGVGLLAFAADQFVLGAARVALIRRLSPLLVGVVIIGFGTSSPELLVSASAALGDQPEVAVGNIVGSNIANLSLILGVGALILPITVASSTVKREAPLAVLAALAFAVFVQGGFVWWEGVVLLVALVVVMIGLARSGRAGTDPLGEEATELADPAAHSIGVEIGRTVLGLVGTIVGAQMLLWGALDFADRAGLGEGFVGATLVAIGTSLPELVTVVQSARRGEPDLIVGNLLGSNLFNPLGVGGVVALIGMSDLDDQTLTTVAAGAAVAVSVVALAAMMTGRTVRRAEGAALVVLYLVLVPFMA